MSLIIPVIFVFADSAMDTQTDEKEPPAFVRLKNPSTGLTVLGSATKGFLLSRDHYKPGVCKLLTRGPQRVIKFDTGGRFLNKSYPGICRKRALNSIK